MTVKRRVLEARLGDSRLKIVPGVFAVGGGPSRWHAVPIVVGLLLLLQLVSPCLGAVDRPTDSPGSTAATAGQPQPTHRLASSTSALGMGEAPPAATGGSTASPAESAASAGSQQQLAAAAAVFLEQPEQEHYIRSVTRNYTIVCRAYAVEMDVRCANENLPRQSLRLQRLPDTTGGTRQTVMRVEANITRGMVMSYFGDYTCECVAHQDLLGGKRVSSSRVRVYVAYLNKIFHHEPLSTSVGYLQQVELKCQAPDGQPQPSIYWLKDGKEILPPQDINFIITSEGSLIINQARVDDEGNYTCGARNSLGMYRLTDPATVTVNVDGGWTPWSSWTACDSVCGPSMQQRARECKLPAPRNAGRTCEGPASQTNPCNNVCSVAGGWGEWTPWSTCKTDCQRYRTRKCDSPAPQNGGANCDGLDLENTNCTDSCRAGYDDDLQGHELASAVPATEKESLQSVILYVSLCGAVAVFVISLIVVVLCVMKRLSRRRQQQNDGFSDGGNLADHASDATHPPGQEKRRLNNGDAPPNQPDVTKASVLADRCASRWLHHAIAASSPASGHLNGGDYAESMPMLGWDRQQQQQQQLREDFGLVPSTAPPEYACSNLIGSPLLPDAATTTAAAMAERTCPTWPLAGTTLAAATEPPPAAYCCCGGSNGVCGGGRSAYPTMATATLSGCQHREAEPDVIVVSGGSGGSSSVVAGGSCFVDDDGRASSAQVVVGSGGAHLTADGSGVGLVIPDGALAKGHCVEFFVACSRDDKDRPPLLDKQTLLSPVVMCSPHDVAFQKPLVLSFDHCADIDRGQWKLSLYCTVSPYSEDSPVWERLVTLNQEVHNPPACCHVEASRCHAVVDRLAARYCLIGESTFGERAVKRLKLAAFARPHSAAAAGISTGSSSVAHGLQQRDHTIRIYVLPDTLDALQSVINVEAQLGARIIDKPRQLFFQDGGNSLCIVIDSMAVGWASKQSSNYQEIPFSHIWNSSQNYLHCSFTFENVSTCLHPFACRLQLYQKSAPTNRQMLLIASDTEAAVHPGSASVLALQQQATAYGAAPPPLQRQHQQPMTGSQSLLSSLSLSSSSSSGCSSMAADGVLPSPQQLQLPPPTYYKPCTALPDHRYQQQQQRQHGPLHLQPHIKQLICSQLDSLTAQGNDWRRLAPLLLGSDRQLSYFASKHSPTELILSLWEAHCNHGSASLGNLTKALRFMGRDDIASIVDEEAGKAWS